MATKQDRPSRTSNGSLGSMSQSDSPSMAPQSPSPRSYQAPSPLKFGSFSPQTNGLTHNSTPGPEPEPPGVHEPHPEPLEDISQYVPKRLGKESTSATALVIGDESVSNQHLCRLGRK